MRNTLLIFSILLITKLQSQTIVNFENIKLDPDTFWDGSDLSSKGILTDEIWFPTNWKSGYLYDGFVISNKKDTTTKDYNNPYSSRSGGGYYGSMNFMTAFNPSYFLLTGTMAGKTISGAYINTNTYGYYTMLEGNIISTKFGGATGNDPDFFRIIFKGFFQKNPSKDSVIFYLADFRDADNQNDYIIRDWSWVDLSLLGKVDSVAFYFESSDTGFYGINTPTYFCMDNLTISGQEKYPPAAGKSGTSAIFKDSAAFVSWATKASIIRGPKQIGVDSLGKADAGTPENALGKAGVNGIVSLGDGGEAILEFQHPITNGSGWDFAVFENGFNDTFLELAFVEVSSDGKNYFRFAPVSLTDTNMVSNGFDVILAEDLNNLAGKYRAGYGTPFDLEELKNIQGLDVERVTHVKVIDAVGTPDPAYCRRDSEGRKIRDPWPTPYASSGFDLDAIGVIHEIKSSGFTLNNPQKSIMIFPQPADEFVFLKFPERIRSIAEVNLYSLTGELVSKQRAGGELMEINISGLTAGIYFIKGLIGNEEFSGKLIVK